MIASFPTLIYVWKMFGFLKFEFQVLADSDFFIL